VILDRVDAVTLCARVAYTAERLLRRAEGGKGGPTWRDLPLADRITWSCFVEAVLGGLDPGDDQRFACLVVTGAALRLGLRFVRNRAGGLPTIAAAVGARRGFRVADLAGRQRTAAVAEARHAAMLLGRQAGFSTVAIGRFFGGRDHVTVMRGLQSVRKRMARDPELSGDVGAVAALLGLEAT
jgi:hypothetical protein